jgi:hypothetical protein
VNVIRNALFALTLAAMCVAPALAVGASAKADTVTAADVDAFNDTLASGSDGRQGMIGHLNELQFDRQHKVDAPLTGWAFAATAAKVCSIKVHEETGDVALARLPKSALINACFYLKAHLAHPIVQDGPLAASYRSWACGWPAPLPAFRTVPSE